MNIKRVVPVIAIILQLSSGSFAFYQHQHIEPAILSGSTLGGSNSISMQSDHIIMGPDFGSSGLGYPIGNQQIGFGSGYQGQTIGGNGIQNVGFPIVGQQQNFGVGFGGSLNNLGSIAGALGLGLLPGFDGGMEMTFSIDGLSRQFETVFWTQFERIVGGDSNSSTTNNLEVSTGQFQAD